MNMYTTLNTARMPRTHRENKRQCQPEAAGLPKKTHPGERDVAASVGTDGALGGLLEVVSHKLAPGRLHGLGLVGLGVVRMAPGVGYAPVPANHLLTTAVCGVDSV